MLNISEDTKNYLLNGSEFNFKKFWKIKRSDGVIIGFTNNNDDYYHDNILYKKTNSSNSSDIQNNSSLAVNNLEVSFSIDGLEGYFIDDKSHTENFSFDYIRVGLYDNATIDMFMIDIYNPSVIIPLPSGKIGNIYVNKYNVKIELRGIEQRLQGNFGRVYTLNCSANFGDSNCKVNKTNYTKNDTVKRVINKAMFTCDINDTMAPIRRDIENITGSGGVYTFTVTNHGLTSGSFVTISNCQRLNSATDDINGTTHPIIVLDSNNFRISFNDLIILGSTGNFGTITQKIISEFYKDGLLKWTSGRNSTINNEYKIKNYNPNRFELYVRPLYPIEVGDTFQVVAGCDKTPQKCSSVFNNMENYYGFNLIPGDDNVFKPF